MACIEGRLPEVSIRVEDKACAVVVVASGGYPGPYEQGKKIELHTEAADPALHFFHAGTKLREDGTLVTAGGRVIAVSATADSLEDAVKLAYEGVGMIEFEGMFYRRDIAHRALPKKET
ncbi:phosphoribosylamine-glycine ligase [Phlyctema vagabunda]|uniref:Glycinamide ribonucleotide synthetase n=1 Tax=Phlyctema vagabunda TaxID=108571 RepID=A0ABR4PEI0_9HELO